MTGYRILRRARCFTALYTMPNVARHFYENFHVGLKADPGRTEAAD